MDKKKPSCKDVAVPAPALSTKHVMVALVTNGQKQLIFRHGTILTIVVSIRRYTDNVNSIIAWNVLMRQCRKIKIIFNLAVLGEHFTSPHAFRSPAPGREGGVLAPPSNSAPEPRSDIR